MEIHMQTQPTSNDGESVHSRFMAFNDPSTPEDTNQLGLLPEDEDNSTHDLEDDQIGDDVEVAEEITDDSQADESEEDAEVVPEGESEESETQYQLSDIAALSGIDENHLDIAEDGTLMIKTKIDGVEGTANLKDLLTSYQLKGHLDKQNQKAVEMQKAYEAKQAELDSQVQAKLQQLEDLSNIAYSDMMREYNSVDWQDLRQNDPAEFAALQREYEQRNQAIQMACQGVNAERQQLTAKESEKLQAVYESENTKLVTSIPSWDKPEVAQKEFSEVLSYGERLGYPSQALKSIQNHLDVVVLRKAMLYDQMQEKKPSITQKVKKAPKLVRPGSPATHTEKQATSKNKARETLRKHGDKKGAFAEYLLKTNQV